MTFNPDPAAPLRTLAALPGFAATPLRTLSQPAGPTILIKDERDRMGLSAFKAVGGIHAVATLMAERGDIPTFVCASAGNHGYAVATGARLLGAKARIHLSRSTPAPFVTRLESAGAEVVISDARYDELLLEAAADAATTGAILLSDTADTLNDRPPALVMEGYTLIAEELRAVFEVSGRWPTEVYLQAGVGGLAAAMAHMVRANWRVQPRLVIVEPEAAPCLAASAKAGRPVRVEGPDSVMGRLDCKAPSVLAHAVLARCEVEYAAVSDAAAQTAADHLAFAGLPTTPSGAAGLAALLSAAPPADARPLIILTEGPLA
ncbi:pyridoxal-phosphate dependent enzyme [Caulobacter sp.]|uniref:pyridoxal-phosphate dependent enzyme n=1 Tax=Caulobacter sp. TaxID=78 RepID=UPI001B0236C2|nr:pyridoxal-phosphate dependent enzyme [Caulobacter sp.]MBO9545952.1 pyridoxal-phosphate dependent enzyme [Caulobacter sp.]